MCVYVCGGLRHTSAVCVCVCMCGVVKAYLGCVCMPCVWGGVKAYLGCMFVCVVRVKAYLDSMSLCMWGVIEIPIITCILTVDSNLDASITGLSYGL